MTHRRASTHWVDKKVDKIVDIMDYLVLFDMYLKLYNVHSVTGVFFILPHTLWRKISGRLSPEPGRDRKKDACFLPC